MISTSPRPFVFVLMPFDKNFDDTYQLGIKAACESARAYCERVDEQVFTDNILSRIINQIAKADIVVADMSNRNPNVFYETGYAHALGKTVILLTRRTEDIPFDMNQYPHIVYGESLVALRDQLKKKVEFFIKNPKVNPTSGAWSLQLFQDGEPLKDGGTLKGKIVHSGFLAVVIEVHNPTSRTFHGQNTKVALVYSDMIMHEVHFKGRSVKLPDGRMMITLPTLPDVYPEGWAPYRFDLKAYNREFKIGESFPLTVRLYTPWGL